MTNNILLLKSYFKGIKTALGKKKAPSPAQWLEICEYVESIQVPPEKASAGNGIIPMPKPVDPNKPRPAMSSGSAMSAGP